MSTVDRSSLRSAYLYLVCLVTLVLAIFAAVNLVRDTSRLLFPDPAYYGFDPVAQERQTPAEREEQRELALQAQRRQALQGMVGSTAMLLIATPVYLYHWRRVQEESRPPAAPTPAG